MATRDDATDMQLGPLQGAMPERTVSQGNDPEMGQLYHYARNVTSQHIPHRFYTVALYAPNLHTILKHREHQERIAGCLCHSDRCLRFFDTH